MYNEGQRISLKYDETFKELKEYLLKLFRQRGLPPSEFINKNSFFLEKDTQFHQIARKKATIDSSSTMHSILARLSMGKTDFSKLKVSVTQFCEELAFYLYSSHNYKENADQQIRKYNAEELKNIIEEKIKLLSASEGSKDPSKLEIKVQDIKDFPEDSYTFRIVLKEVVQEYDKEKRESKLMSLFEKQTEVDIVGINSEAEFPSVPFEGLYLDLERSNKVSSNKFSGSTLSGFYLYVYNNLGKNVFAETETEYFLNIIMAYLEKFCETSTNSFTIPWKMTCQSRVSRKIKGMQDFKLNLNLKVTLDRDTQVEILKRANLIFYNLIASKAEEEMAINSMISEYFPSSSEDIHFILAKSNEKRENCGCSSCSIF